MTPDDPRRRLLGRPREYQERLRAHEDAGFETRMVEFLLAVFKFPAPAVRALRAEHRRRTGLAGLTFATFAMHHPGFPVRLAASRLDGVKLHTDPRAVLPALFRDFARVPFVVAYDALVEQRAGDDDRPLGLVFPRKGFRKGMIIHDGAGLDPAVSRGLVLTYQGRDPRHRLFVQPYQTFLEGLYRKGRGWRPEP